MTTQLKWFELLHPEDLDSPALLVFPERVKHNIQTALKMLDGNMKWK